MKKTIAAIVLSVAFMAGCSGEPPSGTVVDKRYEEATSETKTRTKQSCSGTGTKRRCTTKPETYVDHDDEDFVLVLETKDGDVTEREVSEDEYKAAKVGDFFGEKE